MAKQRPKARKARLTSRTKAHPKKMAPTFKSEAEERAFWEAHDSTDYIDWTQATSVRLANLKPSTQTISLRLPVGLLERIKVEANRRDMPYQSLIKAWLADQVNRPRV
jgi:predicted DNA binding CopG/RHH family protein